MKEEHARFLTDEEILAEVKYLSEHQDEMLSESKERDAWFSDPQNASVIEAEQAKMDLVIALYNARKEAGLTQKELAERLGTNQSYIAQLEKGKKNVTFHTLLKYATACGKRIFVTLA